MLDFTLYVLIFLTGVGLGDLLCERKYTESVPNDTTSQISVTTLYTLPDNHVITFCYHRGIPYVGVPLSSDLFLCPRIIQVTSFHHNPDTAVLTGYVVRDQKNQEDGSVVKLDLPVTTNGRNVVLCYTDDLVEWLTGEKATLQPNHLDNC